MQHMSSKQDELLMHASELFDGHCHHSQQEDFALFASDDVQQHANNWALIGSVLRNELPKKVDVSFTSSVMARVREEAFVQKHSESAHEDLTVRLPSLLRKGNQLNSNVNAVLSKQSNNIDALYSFEQTKSHIVRDQVEIVADKEKIADIQMVSEQKAKFFTFKRLALYVTQIGVAASVAVVTIIGLQTYNVSDPTLNTPASTAQTNSTAISGLSLASYQSKDNDILLNLEQVNSAPSADGTNYKADIKQQQQQEMEKINLYVQGYVLDTASRN